ncbi:MAG: 5'-nucleotidase C-terminal domain-containing protein [Bacilli bacterium]
MKKDKNLKYWTILLSLATTCILSLSLSRHYNENNKIFAQFGGNGGGYTCYIPEGETEIRDLVAGDSSHDTLYYKTRGTVTSIQQSEDGYYRAFIQRTNGEDGSKSSLMLYEYVDPYFPVAVGNVIDVDGVYTYYGGNTPELIGHDSNTVYQATVAEETNPHPVESWEMSVGEFNTYASSFSFRDMSRLVTIKNVKFTRQVSGSISFYGSSIYENGILSDATDNYENMSLRISTFNVTTTNAMPDILNSHINKNAIFDLTGVITYLSSTSEYALMLVDASDISIVSEDEDPYKKYVEVFAVNDFHGAIEETSTRAGLANFGTFFKEQGERDNTLLIDSGDTWQGSIYSNYNYGRLITDVMNYAKFDAHTVGNHDFDWGTDVLAANVARDYDGYTTPTLAANVYDFDFDTKTIGTEQQSELGQKSVTYTLENGLEVGIVGVIGQDQITSINSLYTQDIAFKNHVDIIKDEAYALKNNGVDIVIASVHGGEETVKGQGLELYVDLVLCAHTHRKEYSEVAGLTYAQFGAYGEYFGRVTLEYDTDLGKVVDTDITEYSASDISAQVTTVDSTISNLIDQYSSDCDAAANEVVASNVTGDFVSFDHAANLMTKAMYDQAVVEGYDIDLAYCNTARANLDPGSWTFADIYGAFPFDNTIYIIEITGEELLYEVKGYNNIYRNPAFTEKIRADGVYTIACLDYLAFHTNSARYYDYFPDNNGAFISSLSDNYRIILYNWLKNNNYNTGTELKASDYASTEWQHDRSKLYADYANLSFCLNYDAQDETVFDDIWAIKGRTLSSQFPSTNPFRCDYKFLGWYLDRDGTISIDNTEKVENSISLYAKWEPLGADWNSLGYNLSSFSDIYDIGYGLNHNDRTTNSYYVQGEIDSIVSDYYGNMYLTDPTGNSLYIYGLNFGSLKYGEMDPSYKPIVGDVIILSGQITKFYDNIEMVETQLIARNGVLIP